MNDLNLWEHMKLGTYSSPMQRWGDALFCSYPGPLFPFGMVKT